VELLLDHLIHPLEVLAATGTALGPQRGLVGRQRLGQALAARRALLRLWMADDGIRRFGRSGTVVEGAALLVADLRRRDRLWRLGRLSRGLLPRHDGEQLSEAVIEAIRTVPDFDATEEYANRPENKVTRPSFAVADFPSLPEWDEYDEDDEDEDEDDEWESDGDDDSDDQDSDEDSPVHGDHGDYSGLGRFW